MGRGLHQTLWDLLRRLSDAGPHFEAKRVLVQRVGRRVQSNTRRRVPEKGADMSPRSAAVGLVIFLTAHACLSQQATTQPSRSWMNASLPPDLRAEAVVKLLTLDEKIQLGHGIGWGPLKTGSPIPPDNNGGAGEGPGNPRLGHPSPPQTGFAWGSPIAGPPTR